MSDWRIRFEPVLTPLFRAWWRLRRPTTLGVRAIVTDVEGRVLLVRHSYARGWHLPGGGVERLETAADAIRREVAEEGGAEATETPLLLGFFANHANFPNDHIALYRITAWQPCAPAVSGEISERGFFALDALPGGTTGATRRRLAEVFKGAAQAADW